DPFDLKVIVQTISKSKEVELDQLQLDLRKMLGGKRYLLVLDDVWEENRENWLKLKTLLMGGAEGSRVVVTTRSKAV
ncbi:NB-ARC domain-containing protein, partial [Escherichia coli]|nr:NB-ARC domain-containing protein [Escherichia coli]